MPDTNDDSDRIQQIYDELNRRGVFQSNPRAAQIGHELRRRGAVSDPTQGGLVNLPQSKPARVTSSNAAPSPLPQTAPASPPANGGSISAAPPMNPFQRAIQAVRTGVELARTSDSPGARLLGNAAVDAQDLLSFPAHAVGTLTNVIGSGLYQKYLENKMQFGVVKETPQRRQQESQYNASVQQTSDAIQQAKGLGDGLVSMVRTPAEIAGKALAQTVNGLDPKRPPMAREQMRRQAAGTVGKAGSDTAKFAQDHPLQALLIASDALGGISGLAESGAAKAGGSLTRAQELAEIAGQGPKARVLQRAANAASKVEGVAGKTREVAHTVGTLGLNKVAGKVRAAAEQRAALSSPSPVDHVPAPAPIVPEQVAAAAQAAGGDDALIEHSAHIVGYLKSVADGSLSGAARTDALTKATALADQITPGIAGAKFTDPLAQALAILDASNVGVTAAESRAVRLTAAAEKAASLGKAPEAAQLNKAAEGMKSLVQQHRDLYLTAQSEPKAAQSQPAQPAAPKVQAAANAIVDDLDAKVARFKEINQKIADAKTPTDLLGPDGKTTLSTERNALYADLQKTAPDRLKAAQLELGRGTEATKATAPVRSPSDATAPLGNLVYTPDNHPVPYHYKAVEADDLIPSHTDALAPNPKYDAALQPRDRSRVATEEQVGNMARDLNPSRLGESASTAEGAPITGPDYMVESGNGRTLSVRRAYQQHPEKASEYRAYLEQNAAKFGVDPEALRGMKQPVLVRVRDGELPMSDRAALAERMGKSPVATMSETETAVSDGKRLRSSGLLDSLKMGADGGNFAAASNVDFVRKFMEGIPAEERAALIQSDGALSASGQRRVRNAVLASAYDDVPTLTRLMESTDDNVKGVGAAMVSSAPRFAQLREGIAKGTRHAGLDITGDITAAANTLSDLRGRGRSVPEHLAQTGLFGEGLSPVAQELLNLFDKNKRSPGRIGQILETYAEAADKAGDPAQMGLFGGEAPTRDSILRAAQELVEERNGKRTGTGGGKQSALDIEAETEPAPRPDNQESGQRRKPTESAGGNGDDNGTGTGEGNASERAATRRVTLSVNGEEKAADLTPEQAAKWDEATARYTEERQRLQKTADVQRKLRGRVDEVTASRQKTLAMRHAAEKRRIAGLLTPKEQGQAVSRMRSTLDTIEEGARERLKSHLRDMSSKLNAVGGVDPRPLADLVLLGAVKLAKATLNFAEWSKQMITDAPELARLKRGEMQRIYYRAEEAAERINRLEEHQPPPPGEPKSPLKLKKQQSLLNLTEKLTRPEGEGAPTNARRVLTSADGESLAVGQITPDDWQSRVETTLTAPERQKARQWFSDLRNAFERQYGKAEAPRQMMAWLLSQRNTSPSRGMMDVLTLEDRMQGRDQARVGGKNASAVESALKGEAPTEGFSAKLSDFVDSALGKTTRTFMGDDPRAGAPATVDIWSGRDAGFVDKQALGYLKKKFGDDAIRGLADDSKGYTGATYEHAAEFYNDLAHRLNEKGFDGGNWTPAEVQSVGWVAIQKVFGRAAELPTDIFSKNTRRISAELAFGAGSPLAAKFPALSSLPFDQAAAITGDVMGKIVDAVSKETGARIISETYGPGGYGGDVSPSVQLEVFGSPETIQDVADAIGYLTQQTEVYTSRPLKSGGNASLRIYEKSAGKFADSGTLARFAKRLTEEVSDFHGFQPVDVNGRPGLLFINPDGQWRPADLARISEGIERVADEFGVDLDGDNGTIDLTKTGNDWKEYPDGQLYLQRTDSRGRRVLSERLRDDLVPRVEGWVRDAFDRHAGNRDSGGGTGTGDSGPASPGSGAETGQNAKSDAPARPGPEGDRLGSGDSDGSPGSVTLYANPIVPVAEHLLKQAKRIFAPKPGQRDAGLLEQITSPLSVVDGKGRTLQRGGYERVYGEAGKTVSELFRDTQQKIDGLKPTENTLFGKAPTTPHAKQRLFQDLRKNLQPHVNKMRTDGLPGLADMVEAHVTDLEKYKADAFSRIVGVVTSVQNELKLSYNLRSAAINFIQPLATLWPYISTKDFAALYAEYAKPETRKWLDAQGVFEGGTKLEGEKPARKTPFGMATSVNRGVSYLYGYEQAKAAGLTDALAHKSGLAWAEKTEFDSSKWNAPPVLRGNLARLLLQYKSFQVKSTENVANVFSSRPEDAEAVGGKVGGYLARTGKFGVGQIGVGGVKSVKPVAAALGGLAVYRALKQSLMEKGQSEKSADELAKAIFYGAPALIGQDLSGSVSLFDPPFGNTEEEKLVNFFGGPTTGTGLAIWKGVNEVVSKPKAKDKVKAAVRTIGSITPYMKQADAVQRLIEGGGHGSSVRAGKKDLPLTTFEGVMRGLGFTPVKQSFVYDEKDLAAADKQKVRQQSQAR